MLPILALADRGVQLTDGDTYYIQFIHASALDDPPVVAATRREATLSVVRHVNDHTQPPIEYGDVTTALFTADELAASLARHSMVPGGDHWPARLAAIVAYHHPTKETR